jgi:hypothetical protein
MASYALSLYKPSSSVYDLDIAPLFVGYTLESSYMREEARIITETTFTIMPPPSYTMSGGSSLKSMERSNAPKGGAKEKKKAPLVQPPVPSASSGRHLIVANLANDLL